MLIDPKCHETLAELTIVRTIVFRNVQNRAHARLGALRRRHVQQEGMIYFNYYLFVSIQIYFFNNYFTNLHPFFTAP